MCLIAWHWQPASPTPLLLLANRDEFYSRPTKPLHCWDGGEVLAGKDLQGGGTWLGVGRNGRLAAITNHRDPTDVRPDAPSRGELVANFLLGDLGAAAYLAKLSGVAHAYNPFNLLLLDGQMLLGFESRGARTLALEAGFGGVSNAGFDTPWPKLVRLKQGLQNALFGDRSGAANNPNDAGNIGEFGVSNAELLSLLQNRSLASDAQLPSTGIALERERALSAAFISTSDYGTRACSIVRMGKAKVEFFEAGFDAGGGIGAAQFEFATQAATPA